MSHLEFATTTRGLRRQSPPMRLFEKAKLDQFARHFERIEKARGASLEEIERITSSSVEENGILISNPPI